MPVEAWARLNPTTQHTSWEFLTLKLAMVKKFHEYLYGSTFDVHMDNNPLMYVLTTAKLDAASHHWVTSLANYNFILHYRTGKANIDTDALSRLSWPGPNSSGTHLKVTATAVRVVQEAALKGLVSPIEACSCDLHVLDAMQESKQVTCMTLDDWHQVREMDPVLSLVITRLRDGMLGKRQSQTTDPPKSFSNSGSAIIWCSKRVSYTDEPSLENQRWPSFSWFCQLYKGMLLSEDAMMRLVIWAWSTCLTWCMIGSSGLAWLPRLESTSGSVACGLAFKARQPKAPQKHHGHTSSGACSPWLSVPGTWKGPRWECSGSHRLFHQVCPGTCNQDPNCPDDCQTPVGQVHCPLWVAQKDPNGSRPKFWESVGGWPLWADGNVEDMD